MRGPTRSTRPRRITLTAGQHVTDTLTVSSSDGTATQDIVVNITGSNDSATITASASEDTAVTEAGGLANASAGDPSASGQLTVHDVDSGEDHFAAPASLAGDYGTFTFNATTGAWTYTLDQAKADQLTDGQHVTDTLTVSSSDGTATQDIVVNITGSNDFATITASASEDTAVTEAGGLANASAGDPSASGQLTVHDVDSGEDHFAAPASLAGDYGTFTFNATTGAWTYTLDQAKADQLTAGQHVTDTLTVSSSDGTATQDIVVNITGSNDFATITASASEDTAVTEAGGLANASAGDPSASGQLTVHDVDTGEDHFATPASLAGDYGTFTFNTDHRVPGPTRSTRPRRIHLTAGQHVTDTLTVSSSDGTATQDIVVNITGSNDAPVLDLDANNSTATGSNYVATFTDTGSAVAIADSDVSIIDPDNANMASATVTLTNAKAGDVLAINGSLPAGIGYTINTAIPGVITVTLSGSASKAAYDAALNQIVFNTSVNPDTTDRNLTVVVNDGLANGNTATSTIHIVDATSPTVSSIAIVDAGADGTVHTGETGTVTITFSEKVTGFTASDVTVTNGSIGAVSSSDGGKTWTATFTPAATTEATAHISVANTYTDLAGNAGTASAADGTILADTKSPTVSSIAIVDAGADGTVHTGETGTVTITFSEKVTGFTASDVTVTNGSIGAVSSSDGGKTWTATFTPAATTEATAHISVANTYTDLAGNVGTASAADGTILVDTKSPTVVITTSHHGSSSDVTFTFSEAVSGFSSSDVTIVGGNAGTITHVGAQRFWPGYLHRDCNPSQWVWIAHHPSDRQLHRLGGERRLSKQLSYPAGRRRRTAYQPWPGRPFG